MELLVMILFVVVVSVVIYNFVGKPSETVAKTPGPAWYESSGTTAAIRPYRTVELATTDANLAAPFGWSIQSVSNSDGHINVGRTVSGAVLTGGLSLLAGGSRTQGSVTVTFVRAQAPVAAVA